MIKQTKSLLPKFILKHISEFKKYKQNVSDSKRPAKEIFAEIYRDEKWEQVNKSFCQGGF